MVKQDYIMRLIHELVRTVLRLIFGIDEEKEELIFSDAKARDNDNKLLKMADEGKINEAENLIYEELDTKNLECLKNALLFYDYINKLDDEKLAMAEYSREEIAQGIETILREFGYSGFKDIF